ncbi:unnamed protein product [Arctia plantaginis]|uniref:Uncharacterized protein n=1 Tax=Arctia plantaginis TaxID=874455 RepID=A0A8S0ZNB4_ARCPL|nr:unnamed protein product [Arctia plantaginis]CAB3235778.1 unnamed protein product [Arctia plantaginis]
MDAVEDRYVRKMYSPAAVISHHQQQQAVTSARAPAISAAAHDTRALAGRPGGLSAAPHDRCSLAPLGHAPSRPSRRPHPAEPRCHFPSFLRERARCPLFWRIADRP